MASLARGLASFVLLFEITQDAVFSGFMDVFATFGGDITTLNG